MNVVVYGAAPEIALGKMCARGIKSLGHRLQYVEKEFRTFPLIGTINPDTIHDEFEATATDPNVDAVLVLKGNDLSRDRLNRIKRASDAVLCNWYPDNPYQVRSKNQIATDYLDTLPAYDVVFTCGRFLVDRLQEEGADDVRYLPFAHDPKFHFAAEPSEEYRCEVAFLGHYSPKRRRVLSALTNFDFKLWGNMWRWKCFDWSLQRSYCGPALGHPQYTKAMSSADLVVNVVADHNMPDHNMRTFEAPASGSLMVTTRSKGQQRYFPEGKGCVMYNDPAELEAIVTQYLENDEEREAIAARGRELATEHTYETRMERLLDAVADHL